MVLILRALACALLIPLALSCGPGPDYGAGGDEPPPDAPGQHELDAGWAPDDDSDQDAGRPVDAGTAADAGECVPVTCEATEAECGPISDGCGGTIQCGGCGAGQQCQNLRCECVPQCDSKQCGPDGCGGTCGTCKSWEGCNVSGQCIPGATNCQCHGTCGTDGCAGICGVCGANEHCGIISSLQGAPVATECSTGCAFQLTFERDGQTFTLDGADAEAAECERRIAGTPGDWRNGYFTVASYSSWPVAPNARQRFGVSWNPAERVGPGDVLLGAPSDELGYQRAWMISAELGAGVPAELRGNFESSNTGSRIEVQFVRYDLRPGGEWELVIRPRARLANASGRVVNVSGWMKGTFAQ